LHGLLLSVAPLGLPGVELIEPRLQPLLRFGKRPGGLSCNR